jgi:very-short-patch-repair endonuclease
MISYNPKLKKLSRELRKNTTDAERCLWSRIRGKQLKGRQFYRQKPIGNYIVDFYCPSAKLIIELDGGQHFSEKGKEKDKKRDSYLKNLGFKVTRYSDIDVLKNIEGVLKDIHNQL